MGYACFPTGGPITISLKLSPVAPGVPGREFWNHRQMFGRIAITRRHNPNLKDKSGREGLLDNRAAKILRELVSNILMQSARKYFGSASDYRKELLPEITADNKQKRAAEARNRLRQRQRRAFRARLNQLFRRSAGLLCRKSRVSRNPSALREKLISPKAQQSLDALRERLPDFSLAGAPKNLGSLTGKIRRIPPRNGRQFAQAWSTPTNTSSHRIEEISPHETRAFCWKSNWPGKPTQVNRSYSSLGKNP